MAWTGYRAPKVACGGLHNGYATPRAKQDWTIGEVVNVGFVKGLEVVKKANGAYLLWQANTNRFYVSRPHMGVTRYETMNDAMRAM